MHQKIVVADEQLSVFGSMNMLSYGKTSSARSRDVMVTVHGRRFAERMLAHENAAELAQRRQCPVCGEPFTECGKTGRPQRWAWLCPHKDGNGKPHELPFPVTR